ncbi:MAG: FAD:protein FMN transferase [Candidatus Aminicenantes bacterium]|jgi:thiamine biosynthesis lipoprotein
MKIDPVRKKITSRTGEIPLIRFCGKIPHDAYRLSHKSMATIFEVFIIHEDPAYGEQAAREAFRLLDRLEQELSRFIANSDINRINNLRRNQSIRIGLDAFECLKRCAELTRRTQGAFDITFGKNGGIHSLEFDDTDFSVKLSADSIHLDLGGFGKGYAIDQMAKLFAEWDIKSVLIHGGRSSALALAEPPGEKGWPVTVSDPIQTSQILKLVHLKHRALSGSGVQKGHHIYDPRTGKRIEGRLAAWASAPEGAVSDALSTAFMVMTLEEIEDYCAQNPDTQGLIILRDRKNTMNRNPVFPFGHWDSLA